MRRLSIVLCLAVMSMVLLVGGCDKQSAPSALRQQSISAESYNMSVVKTVGNYSYIPFNVDGNPSDHAVKILGALSAFEKAHPEIEITFWQIEKQQRAYITSSYIFGIWVTHRPKK